MKTMVSLGFGFILATTALLGWKMSDGVVSSESEMSRDIKIRNPTGFALVELYTSQGCSSTPPANRVLTEFGRLADEDNLPIHVLSLHVDYWNYLGWTDPYSAKEFSRRQYRRSAQFGKSGVYTPQMIVNGTTEFNGADRNEAVRAIRSALTAEPDVSLVIMRNGGEIVIRPRGATTGGAIFVAIAEKYVETEVTSGENEGKRMAHSNVVRHIVSRTVVGGENEVSIPVPDEFSGQGFVAVAWIEDPITGTVKGACSIGL